MDTNALITVHNRIGLESKTVQDKINELQTELNNNNQMMAIISCLVGISTSINEVSNLELCSGVVRCQEKLEQAELELASVFEELSGVKLA